MTSSGLAPVWIFGGLLTHRSSRLAEVE